MTEMCERHCLLRLSSCLCLSLLIHNCREAAKHTGQNDLCRYLESLTIATTRARSNVRYCGKADQNPKASICQSLVFSFCFVLTLRFRTSETFSSPLSLGSVETDNSTPPTIEHRWTNMEISDCIECQSVESYLQQDSSFQDPRFSIQSRSWSLFEAEQGSTTATKTTILHIT